MEVYINHSGGLHKLKYKTEVSNDRKKNEGVVETPFILMRDKLPVRNNKLGRDGEIKKWL